MTWRSIRDNDLFPYVEIPGGKPTGCNSPPDQEWGSTLCSMSGKQMCTCLQCEAPELFIGTQEFQHVRNLHLL